VGSLHGSVTKNADESLYVLDLSRIRTGSFPRRDLPFLSLATDPSSWRPSPLLAAAAFPEILHAFQGTPSSTSRDAS
jgi:hypothetical protein